MIKPRLLIIILIFMIMQIGIIGPSTVQANSLPSQEKNSQILANNNNMISSVSTSGVLN